MFWNSLETRGTAPALIAGDGTVTGYDALAAAADRWQDTYAGLVPGTAGQRLLVAVSLYPRADLIAAYLGALRAGHAVLLVDDAMLAPGHPLLAAYRPNIVVRGDRGAAEARPGDPEPPALHPDLALLLSTSGTTGSPKLVRLSAANIQSNALAIADYLQIGPDERAITSLPLFYSYGMSVLHSHLAAGAALVLTERSVSDAAFWQLFREAGATSLAMVPHQFDLLEAQGFGKEPLPGLRYVTQAGGKLPQAAAERFAALAERGGWRMYVMYGQTEAAPRMAYIPPGDLAAHAGTIGRAIPGGRLWVADDAGTEIAAPGVPGELMYQGPNVMMGYAEARGELALGQGPDILATGDIAERTEAGYFRIVGRLKRFVKLYGLRLSLDQMEQHLAQEGISAFCLNADDHLVVLSRDASALGRAAELLCAGYGLPAGAVLAAEIAEVPLMPSGKTDFRRLQEIAADEVARAGKAPAGGSTDLRAAFRSATRTAEPGPGDTFTGLGGDSLGYLQVAMTLEARLGYLPANWENTPLGDLEAMVPEGGGRAQGTVTADVLVRLIAVVSIVANHATAAWPIGGGSWTLLMIVGYSLARFGRAAVSAGRQVPTVLKMFHPILPLYFLILAAAAAAGQHVEISMWTLTNNFTSVGSGFLVSPNWFISLYVQAVILCFALLSVPRATRWMERDSWSLGVAAALACLAGTLALQWGIQAWIEAHGEIRTAFRVRSLPVCLLYVATGFAIFCADTARRRAATALLVVAAAAVFPHAGWEYSINIGLMGLLLLSDLRFRAPRWLADLLRIAAGTTLFVYLLHGVVAHAVRHVLHLPDRIGLALSALLAVAGSFLLAWAVKAAFDLADRSALDLWRRLRGHRRGAGSAGP